ncbi:MAG: dephospho-CoA kinase [Verrucomicrobiales bacterium]|nr:dephospho-CoA kinase [Verrucomicrobiales bacterium]
MKLLGLTGGVGMGKSVAAACLAEWGLPVADTDELARQLVAPGQPANAEIRSAFGDPFFDPAGGLRREALARLVFADEPARRQLEAILHPRIRDAWQERVAVWHSEGRAGGVVVIPLLFETQAADAFDATICVACPAASQRERLAARGWSPEASAQRIRALWPIEEKLVAADFVVWAEGGVERTAEQLRCILRDLGLAPTAAQ